MTSSNINHFLLFSFHSPRLSPSLFLSTSFLKTLRLSTLKSRERLWWAESSSDCSLPSPHGWVCSDDVIGNTMHGKPMEVMTSYQLWSIGRCWENPRSFWLLFLRNLDNWHSQQAQTWVRDGSSPSALKSSFFHLYLISTFLLPSPLPSSANPLPSLILLLPFTHRERNWKPWQQHVCVSSLHNHLWLIKWARLYTSVYLCTLLDMFAHLCTLQYIHIHLLTTLCIAVFSCPLVYLCALLHTPRYPHSVTFPGYLHVWRLLTMQSPRHAYK